MEKKEQIVILGATGSVGQSTLDVVRANADRYTVLGVSGFTNSQKLAEICAEFTPKYVAIGEQHVQALQAQLHKQGSACQVWAGEQGLLKLATLSDASTVVAAIVGAAGLAPVLAAAKAGKKILLANKEALVMAGDLVMRSAYVGGARILPIDSEHNALFQCLPQAVQEDSHAIHDAVLGIKKLWLTASGGAFLNQSYAAMQQASVAQAVAHPNWSMGQKISIDSATMMNKGLEVIEACHLFGVPVEKIGVVIHPQSVVHALVEYQDGTFLAQLAAPDMKTPIAHALAYPERITGGKVLDLQQLADLSFTAPDQEKFACLALAMQAQRLGNGACIVLNAANEVAVQAFLREQIALTDIAKVIEHCLKSPKLSAYYGDSFDALDAILTLDKQARMQADGFLDNRALGGRVLDDWADNWGQA